MKSESGVELSRWRSGFAEETGAWSQGAQPACRAAQNCGTLEKAGERSPASTEQSEVIGPRDSPSDAEERAGSKRVSTLKEQRPVRSSEASSDRPEPPGHTAGPGSTKSHGATCRAAGTSRVAQRATTKVTGNQPGLSEPLRSSQLRDYKNPRGPVYPCLSWGFSFVSLHERCGAVSVK